MFVFVNCERALLHFLLFNSRVPGKNSTEAGSERRCVVFGVSVLGFGIW